MCHPEDYFIERKQLDRLLRKETGKVNFEIRLINNDGKTSVCKIVATLYGRTMIPSVSSLLSSTELADSPVCHGYIINNFSNMITDLRSDNVTRPSGLMLKHMFSAPVGDMVLDEDPSVNELEQYTASL
ncbi:MAG: beta-eliminating lyase-related protein [Bacteroidales bacterium]